MLIKLPIIDDNKIILQLFRLQNINDIFILSLVETSDEYIDNTDNKNKIANNFIKVLCSNKINGITYLNIYFPLSFHIINNKLWSIYFFFYGLVSNNFNNNIDFFYNFEKKIKERTDYELLKMNDFLKYEKIIWKFVISVYNPIKIIKDINEFNKIFWDNINILLNSALFLIYSNSTQSKKKIPKKIITLANSLKKLKFSINFSNEYTFDEHCNYIKNKNLNLLDLEINKKYFIIINDTKHILIKVKQIIDNIIITSNNKKINYNTYKWSVYPSNDINITKLFIKLITNKKSYFETYLSYNITKINEELNFEKIISYFLNNQIISDLFLFINEKNNNNIEQTDIEILKSNNYSKDFFKYIINKYSKSEETQNILVETQNILVETQNVSSNKNILVETQNVSSNKNILVETQNVSNKDNILNILKILFSNYNYPIKFSKYEIDPNFDDILYFSLYNYKYIVKEESNNENIIFINELNNIIPNKIKLLYYNLMKTFINIINENYKKIFNFKSFLDQIHKSFIKIFFYQENETIKLLKELITKENFNNIYNIIQKKFLLIDITNKITWYNLSNRLSYLKIIIENYNLLFFKDKLNKIIFPEYFDNRIKTIILNPFEMFKYLKKESDFVKWIKFLDNKCINLFINPISLSNDDCIKLSKLIFYLINVKEQNLKDETYNKFIKYCTINSKLILDNNRINLKIKEHFSYIKTNINLGILAKHLTMYNTNTLEIVKDSIPDIIILQQKLKEITHKYHKYKKKYIKTGLSSYTKSNQSLTSYNDSNIF